MIWIVLAIFSIFSVVVLLSACKAASLADQQAEATFADWAAQHPHKE